MIVTVNYRPLHVIRGSEFTLEIKLKSQEKQHCSVKILLPENFGFDPITLKRNKEINFNFEGEYLIKERIYVSPSAKTDTIIIEIKTPYKIINKEVKIDVI
jgi:hypothetical protein